MKNKYESTPSIDYLNEHFRVSFEIDPEAVEFLPEITEEELRTKREKYGILLGTTEIISSEEVKVLIRGILQTEENERGYYNELKEVVDNINLLAIQRMVEGIQKANPEYREFHLIGDIHTHPVKPKEIGGVTGTQPSKGDVESIAKAYKEGALTADKPFVFGIAAPDENGETQYAFYRLMKRGGEYLPVNLEE